MDRGTFTRHWRELYEVIAHELSGLDIEDLISCADNWDKLIETLQSSYGISRPEAEEVIRFYGKRLERSWMAQVCGTTLH